VRGDIQDLATEYYLNMTEKEGTSQIFSTLFAKGYNSGLPEDRTGILFALDIIHRIPRSELWHI